MSDYYGTRVRYERLHGILHTVKPGFQVNRCLGVSEIACDDGEKAHYCHTVHIAR